MVTDMLVGLIAFLTYTSTAGYHGCYFLVLVDGEEGPWTRRLAMTGSRPCPSLLAILEFRFGGGSRNCSFTVRYRARSSGSTVIVTIGREVHLRPLSPILSSLSSPPTKIYSISYSLLFSSILSPISKNRFRTPSLQWLRLTMTPWQRLTKRWKNVRIERRNCCQAGTRA